MAYKQLKLWFDKDLAKLLSGKITQVTDSFDSKGFVRSVEKGVGALELKDRVALMSDLLDECLSLPYPEQAAIWTDILGPENIEETGMFKEFYWVMPIAKHVELYGLPHFKISLDLIEEITKRNTGEYTIRPYIEANTKKTMVRMKRWSKSPNKHVRRLATEGCRPRLPWAPKLDVFIKDPSLILPILEQLKNDPSKYVQKSVANNINDILKDNESIGRALLDSWLEKPSKSCQWIIKHAIRNYRKKEIPWALQMIEKL